jgi:hypothetical protein
MNQKMMTHRKRTIATWCACDTYHEARVVSRGQVHVLVGGEEVVLQAPADADGHLVLVLLPALRELMGWDSQFCAHDRCDRSGRKSVWVLKPETDPARHHLRMDLFIFPVTRLAQHTPGTDAHGLLVPGKHTRVAVVSHGSLPGVLHTPHQIKSVKNKHLLPYLAFYIPRIK